MPQIGKVNLKASSAFGRMTVVVKVQKDWRFRAGMLLLHAAARIMPFAIEVRDGGAKGKDVDA